MPALSLKKKQINKVRKLAGQIAAAVQDFVEQYTTVSVERTILRLYGVDGVDEEGTPLPNKLVDLSRDFLGAGISRPFAAAMLESKRDAQTTAKLIAEGKLALSNQWACSPAALQEKEQELCRSAMTVLNHSKEKKEAKQNKWALPPQPWKYLIVATGNIYEDRTQAKAAVQAGADIIAVIRSTAQSLLDYVPYGATTEGFGGTYATQENFRIMRKALDEISEKEKRYIRLVNYSSGLCMAEIAACAALEDLDMLLNDSMYGILFRDINCQRTFVDQYFSRLICAKAGIIINTGEDNYLTTSDAVENAHTVTASQLINEALAQRAKLPNELLGLGHAFEIDPELENGFLFELAQAALARELFPEAPLKYMPPTKYKSTDIFFSHCLDSMFNLASITTGQGIHLAGIMTEALHTPLMQDRYAALRNINYIFKSAKDLGTELQFKKGGVIAERAQEVLDQTERFLEQVVDLGLMEAIAEGLFANIKRPVEGGKGLEGVFKKGADYSNPIMEAIENE